VAPVPLYPSFASRHSQNRLSFPFVRGGALLDSFLETSAATLGSAALSPLSPVPNVSGKLSLLRKWSFFSGSGPCLFIEGFICFFRGLPRFLSPVFAANRMGSGDLGGGRRFFSCFPPSSRPVLRIFVFGETSRSCTLAGAITGFFFSFIWGC